QIWEWKRETAVRLGARIAESRNGAKTMAAKVECLLGLLFIASAVASPAFAAEEHRELGVHEHGRGTLNIAIEGNKVTMELEAAGVDIVGFEHAAKTRR